MKLIACFLVLLLVMNTSAISQSGPTLWQEVYGAKIEYGKVYIDINSMTQQVSADGHSKYSSAGILISYADLQHFDVDGKPVFAKSVAKFVTAECNTGAVAYIADFYFTTSLPLRSDVPVKSVTHRSNNVEQFLKTSPVFRRLCAPSI